MNKVIKCFYLLFLYTNSPLVFDKTELQMVLQAQNPISTTIWKNSLCNDQQQREWEKIKTLQQTHYDEAVYRFSNDWFSKTLPMSSICQKREKRTKMDSSQKQLFRQYATKHIKAIENAKKIITKILTGGYLNNSTNFAVAAIKTNLLFIKYWFEITILYIDLDEFFELQNPAELENDPKFDIQNNILAFLYRELYAAFKLFESNSGVAIKEIKLVMFPLSIQLLQKQ